MGLFNWITSGGKQVEKITDAIINTGDALVYTEEEKAEDRAEDMKERRAIWREFMKNTREESSIRSVTRRVIAVAVMGHWLLFLDIAVGSYLWEFYSSDNPNYGAANAIFDLADSMLWIVGGIGAFYFGAHLIRSRSKSSRGQG